MGRTLLVVGCGSIGQRHLRNLRLLRAGRLLATDVRPGAAREAASAVGAEAVASIEAGLRREPDAVLVCTPPSTHREATLAALEAGADVFVEKPLAHHVADARRIVRAAERGGRLVAVGYNLRHEPGMARLHRMVHRGDLGEPVAAVAEFGQYLPAWRPGRDYRKTYTARRSLGGGILLDGSHEIDALRWLLGEPRRVVARTRRPPHLRTDVEGVADVLLTFSRNLQASLHLDFVQYGYERRTKILGTRRTGLWDFGARRLGLRDASGKERTWALEPDANTMYVAEMRCFLDALRGRPLRLPDASDGLQTLRVAEAALTSARRNRQVSL